MYSYNLSEDVWSALMADAQRNLEWLQLRLGLLQHILLQKMGLFSHADTSDMEPWTSVSGGPGEFEALRWCDSNSKEWLPWK